MHNLDARSDVAYAWGVRALVICVVIFSSGLARAAVMLDTAMWRRIDEVNQTLTPLKRASDKQLVPLFEDAVKIMRSFDAEYQRIHSDALDSSDFTFASKAAERALPAFRINFSGGWDVYGIDMSAFAQRAAPDSEMKRFITTFRATQKQIAGSPDRARCLLPVAVGRGDVTVTEREAAKAEWAQLAPTLSQGFLADYAKIAIACLGAR